MADPHVNSAWPAQRKLAVIAAHYAMFGEPRALLRGMVPTLLADAGDGLRIPDAPEIHCQLTHRLRGPRPRDLLLTAFRRFGLALGVAHILEVDNSHRVGSDGHFAASGRLLCSDDEIWNASVAARVSRPEPTSPL